MNCCQRRSQSAFRQKRVHCSSPEGASPLHPPWRDILTADQTNDRFHHYGTSADSVPLGDSRRPVLTSTKSNPCFTTPNTFCPQASVPRRINAPRPCDHSILYITRLRLTIYLEPSSTPINLRTLHTFFHT